MVITSHLMVLPMVEIVGVIIVEDHLQMVQPSETQLQLLRNHLQHLHGEVNLRLVALLNLVPVQAEVPGVLHQEVLVHQDRAVLLLEPVVVPRSEGDKFVYIVYSQKTSVRKGLGFLFGHLAEWFKAAACKAVFH